MTFVVPWMQGTHGKGGTPPGSFHSTEWRRAARIVKRIGGEEVRGGIGKACGWESAAIRREAADYVTVTGSSKVLRKQEL